MMFVNKTLLKNEGINEIPEDWTWEDFYDICSRVTKDTDGNGIEDQFGVCGYTWQHAFITNGVNAFDANGTNCNLLSENAIEAVDFIKKINRLAKEIPSRQTTSIKGMWRLCRHFCRITEPISPIRGT